MKIKKMISVILSCSVVGLSIILPSASAVNAIYPQQYNITKSSESKDIVSGEKPFQVFDIYNAYYGITTTTTTRPTTTTITTTTKPITSTTTTVKTTASTSKTTISTTTSTTATTTKSTSTTTTTENTTTTTAESSADTTTTTTTAPNIPNIVAKGIDVSQWQYNVDWLKVAESDEVDYVIIKAGYGRETWQVDPCFHKNMKAAQDAGIDVGLYWYSYADSVESAKKEAEACYEVIKDYSFEYPIYFDVEEPSILKSHTIAEMSAIIDAFCSEMESYGYYVGVYSYANFLQTGVYSSVLNKYDVWVAQYGTSSPYAYNGNYNMWQYSSTGSIDGIDTDVDLDYCFVDYSAIIEANPDPNFIPPETTALCTSIDIDCEVIDWETVVDSSFIMLDINYSDDSEPDKQIISENIMNARNDGRKIGIMWNADVLTVEEMTEDAEMLHDIIADYKFEYPIYLDLSDSVITDSELSSDEISKLIQAFCSVFDEDKKYYIALKGYDDFLTDRVNEEIFNAYDVWLYDDDDTIRFPYSYGIISRLITNDDGSYYDVKCYRNYPSVMAAYNLNGF